MPHPLSEGLNLWLHPCHPSSQEDRPTRPVTSVTLPVPSGRQTSLTYDLCDLREADVSEEVRQQLRTPTFDSWQWSQEEMLLLLQQMFVDLDLTGRFSVELDTLRRFLLRVFENYNVVPFHNFRHGFCVTQMMYSLVWACDLMVRIDPLDVFILLISCICHDLDHPGYNNIYQVSY
ncbi:High affinity cGMP-specific 3',5'-cyclic phosphodiesterase 9A [Amphibalanus amphitrite]|uniref:High affinity cGMP-specific 3',5'-cyclic phosphodiesterase 9A n=1 Tax=Amphibalanus amphitrite TaxID=1232801 RepID=A0A6A4X6M9_AMPAM|nr:High affinity cGMP-specific 3',5'-cyclic phosphodiesterase 9A [Amphibalanus amphitrite]